MLTILLAVASLATPAPSPQFEWRTRNLTVELALPPGDQVGAEEPEVWVTARIKDGFDPKAKWGMGFKEYAKVAPGETVTLHVPVGYPLAIAAISESRGYVEWTSPTGPVESVESEAPTDGLQFVLPRRTAPSQVTYIPDVEKGTWASGEYWVEATLPLTGIVARARLVNDRYPPTPWTLPPGRYLLTAHARTFGGCGVGPPRPNPATTPREVITLQNGEPFEWKPLCRKGLPIRLDLQLPTGSADTEVSATVARVDQGGDTYRDFHGVSRSVGWGHPMDNHVRMYKDIRPGRDYVSAERFLPGRYQVTITGDSIKPKHLPVTITEEDMKVRSYHQMTAKAVMLEPKVELVKPPK